MGKTPQQKAALLDVELHRLAGRIGQVRVLKFRNKSNKAAYLKLEREQRILENRHKRYERIRRRYSNKIINAKPEPKKQKKAN